MRAAVLTVSDGVTEGVREDLAGAAVAEALAEAGFEVVRRQVVPDDRQAISEAIRSLAGAAGLVATTGGTGLGPRDVSPEATRAVIDREVPGLAEAMRAAGRVSTPMADLSRGVAGALGSTLVVNLPGSARGAAESLAAVLPALPHAIGLLSGDTVHGPQDAPDVTSDLVRRIERGEEVVMATAVRVHGSPPCRPGQKLLVGTNGPLGGTLGCAEFDDAASTDAPGILASGEPALRTYEHDLGSVDVYLEPHGPRPLLVVLGATPVALWLLRWGKELGYDTALVEPRPERVTPEHKEGARVVVGSPEELPPAPAVDAVHTDHDAPFVSEHLAALLRGGVRFVGLMGSRRHAGGHLDAIAALGVDAGRIQTPVGLDLGARTPQEIAMSILAGVLSARTGRAGGWLDGSRGPA
jgi:molybdopterin adenylyltransferase